MRYFIISLMFLSFTISSPTIAQPQVTNIPLDGASNSCVQLSLYRDRFTPDGYATEYTHRGSGEAYMNYGMRVSDRCGNLEIRICSVRVSGSDPDGRHEWSCIDPAGLTYTDIHDVGSTYAIYCSRTTAGCSAKLNQATARISSTRTSANSMEIARLASPLGKGGAADNSGGSTASSSRGQRAAPAGSQAGQSVASPAGNDKYLQSKTARTNGQRLYPPNTNCLWVDPGRQIINRCTTALEANWIDTGGHGNMWTIPGGRSYASTNVKRLVACNPNDGFDWNKNMCRD